MANSRIQAKGSLPDIHRDAERERTTFPSRARLTPTRDFPSIIRPGDRSRSPHIASGTAPPSERQPTGVDLVSNHVTDAYGCVPTLGTLRDIGESGKMSERPNRNGRKIMVDRQYRDELLDASYEAVKLELENSEKDLAKLQARAEKLRAAAAALSALLSTDGQGTEDETAAFLRKSKRSNGLEEVRSDPYRAVPEDLRATA